MQHAIPELDRRGLRQFGYVTGGIVAIVFGIVFPILLGSRWPVWPWIIVGVLGGLALLAPSALRPIYRGWMRFGLLASRITTPLILGIVFFLVIFPMALIKKLVARDAMRRTFEKSAASYRVPSEHRSDDNLKDPF